MIELILGAAIGVGGMIVKDQFLGNKKSEEYAKAQREINTLSDEVERLKKIRNTNLDILNGLSLADKMDDDEDKEEKEGNR